ncbi:endonuclease I family protein [[Clostridium] polysaccharolyticum]|uniref:Endonuclease I n=1 Tax=[Clostridium] polysaccharolyticum TaxID=29364 RepID=A0A1I0CGA3_9FIRM|nr:endonuclease [[Clostridium] polysaccharolyticum]SET18618.1 Endonuclease I [[Clostridium] polysaccharolyticum]
MAYNTGIRDQIATSLSTAASSYYTGSYSYSSLSALSGSSLKSRLYTLMNSTMTKSVTYKSLTTYWPYTDAEKGKSGTVLFYSDEYSTSFNREHVWPKSRGSFYQIKGGCDLHHLRPANAAVNSTRGNHTMGNLNHKGTAVTYSGKTVGWLDTGADMFEPLDNVKGDVARIYLYMYVRWQQPNLYQDVAKSELPAMDSDDSANDGQAVIESLDTLLSWMASDPVDTWEMSRNDLTQDIQGNRNVFIDYPELAWKLFGKTVPSNLTTPSKNSGASTTVPSTKPSVRPSAAPTTTPAEKGVYKRISSVSEIGTGGQFVLVGVNGNYTRAMSNTLNSGRMAGKAVTISNNTISNPDSSIVWTLKQQSAAGRYSLYNSAAGKYLVINANSTTGFAFTSTPAYYFDAANAADKASNAIYLSTTATGKRNISIYQTDFRAYAKANYYPLYLYKLS